MQHLRDVGEGGTGETQLVDATPVTVKGKGKGKAKTVKLEDALREMDLSSDAKSKASVSIFGDEGGSHAPSLVKDRTLEAQQDVPDEIAGFQPGMDPRLREVLEALEDDAYVDEEDEEGLFGSLVEDGPMAELDLEDFEATFGEHDGHDGEGWESDRTEKPPDRQSPNSINNPTGTGDLLPPPQSDFQSPPADAPTAATAVAEDGPWLAEFAKFKRDTTTKNAPQAAAAAAEPTPSLDRAPSTLYTLHGTPLRRRKKRKGALTNPSAYSMTSASLARTDAQRVLDARFDRIAEQYALDDDDELGDDFGENGEDDGDDEDGGVSVMSGLSRTSRMSRASALSTKSFQDGDVRSDLEEMMDGFLERYGGPGGGGGPAGTGGKRGAKSKRGKNGNERIGMAMLDEIRMGLGPARVGVGAGAQKA